jgi:hypothetical protein
VRLAIIGSRTYANSEAVRGYVDTLPPDTVVVTGGWPSLAGGYHVVEATSGVDRIAWKAAERRGLVTVLVAGSKTKHAHLAGLQRNPVIVDIAEACVAFWDLRSSGTGGTLRGFAHANKGVIVIDEAGQVVPHWRQLLPSG